MFLEADVEYEWFVFDKFLYLKGPENSRSSFLQVGETNAEQMALGGLAKLDRNWWSKEGEVRPFRSTESSRIIWPKISGPNRCSEIQLATATRLEFLLAAANDYIDFDSGWF